MGVSILKSRRFWTAVMDMVISLVLYFVSTFYPSQADMIKFVIGAIQPVAVILIAAFTAEDVAALHSAALKYQADKFYDPSPNPGLSEKPGGGE